MNAVDHHLMIFSKASSYIFQLLPFVTLKIISSIDTCGFFALTLQVVSDY